MKSISDLFLADVVCAEARPRLADGEMLHAEEVAYIRNAVPKRRAEFATARVLARQALSEFGAPPVALVPRSDRTIAWPPGFVGSISHTDDYCAVVVGCGPPMRSVGLDVEKLRPLELATMVLILTQRERAWLETQPDEHRNDLAIIIFSCKEAFYKCQYTISRSFLDFQDVAIDLDRATGRFVARVLRRGWPSSVAELTGRYMIRSSNVFCGTELA